MEILIHIGMSSIATNHVWAPGKKNFSQNRVRSNHFLKPFRRDENVGIIENDNWAEVRFFLLSKHSFAHYELIGWISRFQLRPSEWILKL